MRRSDRADVAVIGGGPAGVGAALELLPIPPAVAYGVSKAALLFLVRELAKTQAPHTRINCLCVGSMSPDGREAEIHDVENIEELRAELKRAQLGISSMTEWRVFDQRDIEIMKARSAKCVAAQCSKSTLIWACASGNIDRNIEERFVTYSAHTEIIVPCRPAGGQMRH